MLYSRLGFDVVQGRWLYEAMLNSWLGLLPWADWRHVLVECDCEFAPFLVGHIMFLAAVGQLWLCFSQCGTRRVALEAVLNS